MKENHQQAINTITLSNGAAIEILFDKQATIELQSHLDVLRHLIRLQVDETYESPDLQHWTAEGKLKRFLQWLIKKLSASSSGILSYCYQKVMSRFYSNGWFFGWTKEAEFNWAWNETKRLLAKNRFAVAIMNGEIIAIAAYKRGGKLEDNRDVLELTKFITHPEFRGRGIYGVLREAIIQWIQERYPETP